MSTSAGRVPLLHPVAIAVAASRTRGARKQGGELRKLGMYNTVIG
jgi:hypothetical protein